MHDRVLGRGRPGDHPGDPRRLAAPVEADEAPVDPGQRRPVRHRHRHRRRGVAQLVVDLDRDLPVGLELDDGVVTAGVGVVDLLARCVLAAAPHRLLVATLRPDHLGSVPLHLGQSAGVAVDRDVDHAAESGDRGRQGHRRTVVSAGRHVTASKPRRSGVHGLGEGDPVLLGPGRVAAVELQVDLAEADLPLQVSGSTEARVTHVGVEDVLEGLESEVECRSGVRGERPRRAELRRQNGRLGHGPVQERVRGPLFGGRRRLDEFAFRLTRTLLPDGFRASLFQGADPPRDSTSADGNGKVDASRTNRPAAPPSDARVQLALDLPMSLTGRRESLAGPVLRSSGEGARGREVDGHEDETGAEQEGEAACAAAAVLSPTPGGVATGSQEVEPAGPRASVLSCTGGHGRFLSSSRLGVSVA